MTLCFFCVTPGCMFFELGKTSVHRSKFPGFEESKFKYKVYSSR